MKTDSYLGVYYWNFDGFLGILLCFLDYFVIFGFFCVGGFLLQSWEGLS
jgi:hypothetical protein